MFGIVPISQVPYDAYIFLAGLACFLTPAILSYQAYRRNRLVLHLIIAVLFSWCSIVLFMYSVPLFFANDRRTISIIYGIGDFFYFPMLGAHSYLLWFIMLRRFTEKWWLFVIPSMIAGYAASAYAIYNYFAQPEEVYIEKGFLHLPSLGPFVYVETILSMSLVIIAIRFLMMTHTASKAVSLRYVRYGILYLIVGIVIVSNSFTANDTASNAVKIFIMLSAFVIFIVLTIILRYFTLPAEKPSSTPIDATR